MKSRVDKKGKALHNTLVLSRGWFNPFLLVFLFLLSKGRTIRKVMGGGGVGGVGWGKGNFRAAGIFFRYQIPCMNFF